MVSKSIPRQLRYQTMILVQIVAVVGKDQIRGTISLEFFETVFDFASKVRQKSVTEAMDGHLTVCRTSQKSIRTFHGFLLALLIRAEHDPMNLDLARCRH